MKQTTLFETENNDEPEESGDKSYGRNSAAIGQTSELIFEIVCLTNGWESAKCLSHIAPYDYLLKIDGQWKTVQVKSISCYEYYERRKYFRQGRKVQLFHGGGNRKQRCEERRYKPGDFDYLFATTGNEHWLIPFEEILVTTTLIIDQSRLKKYKITGGIANAKP